MKRGVNIIERMIAVLSPQWACRRAAYREYFRAYEAGEVSRFTDDWMPVNADTENTDKTQSDLIKARARYLENNSDIANAAVSGIIRNVVGTGIKPQARTPTESLNERIEELWAQWIQPEHCDVTGQQSFYEIQAMLLRRQIYDGEILVKKVYDNKAEIPLKLQVIKSDLLAQNQLHAPKTGNIIRSGIELSEHLKPLAYWIEKKTADGYVLYDPDRVPAEEMIHLWLRLHPDQIRGMSMLTPIIRRIKATSDYLEAEEIAARLAACFAVFITTQIGGPGAVGRNTQKDGEGKQLKTMRPGMVTYLNPGESVTTANPSRSVTSAKDFVGLQQRLAGAGMGLSYELMSRDFTKSSFSAARQGMLEDRKTFEPIQQYLETHLCQKVYEEFMDAAVIAGRLSIRDYWENRRTYTRAEWIAPGWSWIDPEKEVNADIKAMASGGKTLAQWCAERGYDWREQLQQMALEKSTAEKLGLILPVHTPESVQAAESNHVDKEEEEAYDEEDE